MNSKRPLNPKAVIQCTNHFEGKQVFCPILDTKGQLLFCFNLGAHIGSKDTQPLPSLSYVHSIHRFWTFIKCWTLRWEAGVQWWTWYSNAFNNWKSPLETDRKWLFLCIVHISTCVWKGRSLTRTGGNQRWLLFKDNEVTTFRTSEGEVEQEKWGRMLQEEETVRTHVQSWENTRFKQILIFTFWPDHFNTS